jgi:hypothetical protein
MGIVIKSYIICGCLDVFLHPFFIMFIHHHQVYLNLHILIIFELINIYVHVPINRSIVERIIYTHTTTNSYEIKVFSLHPS